MMTKLKNTTTLPPKEFSKSSCIKQLTALHQKLFDLQNVFYANGKFSLLVIFQGVDTSGKDGSIRHAMNSMNPMGIHVKSFKAPTEEELKHDFLWRIYPHFPAKGMIQVFNRSYYEDIVVPLVNKKFSKEELHHRISLINHLEEHLELNNTHVLKIFLHVSKEEQKERLKERMTEPHKRWKFAKEDEVVADKWEDYMGVYDLIINKCNKSKWNIIPSDKRWYRNFAVAKTISDYMESLKLKYPKSWK